jgi:hypothetical protein
MQRISAGPRGTYLSPPISASGAPRKTGCVDVARALSPMPSRRKQLESITCRGMAARGYLVREGVVILHPNRDKPEVRATRAVVVLLLLLSAAIISLVTAAGWSVLEGAEPIEIGYIVVYLLLAYLALRWNRGALPVAGALAVFLLIFAAVAAPGWFEHEKSGYNRPSLNADLLGILTLALIPLQILLIIMTTRGFQQGWNVEVEKAVDELAGDPRLPASRAPTVGSGSA